MKWKSLLSLIGISLFVYLVYKIGLSNILSSFRNIKLIPFLGFLALIIPVIFLLNLKWAFILKRQGIELPLLELFKIYMIGLFYGVITPAKAGSLIRAYYIKKKVNKSLIEISTSIIIERALDLLSILFLAILGASFLFKNMQGVVINLIISFVIITGICFFFISEKRTRFVFSLVFKYILPNPLKEKVNSSFSSFYKNIPPIKSILLFTLITLFTWVVVATQAFFMARAFSINISFLNTATIFLIATAVGIIPITVNGLGTREATLIALFSMFSVPAARVMSTSISLLVIGSLIPAFFGFLLSLRKDMERNEIFNNNPSSTK